MPVLGMKRRMGPTIGSVMSFSMATMGLPGSCTNHEAKARAMIANINANVRKWMKVQMASFMGGSVPFMCFVVLPRTISDPREPDARRIRPDPLLLW